MLDCLFVEFLVAFLAFGTVESIEDVIHFLVGPLEYRGLNLVAGQVQFDFLLGFAARFLNTFYPGNDFLDFLVAEKYGVKHFFFGNYVCARFNHHNGVFCACKA